MEPPSGWCPFDAGDRRTYPQLCAPTQVQYADGQTRIGIFFGSFRARKEKRYIGKVVSFEHMPGVFAPPSMLRARSETLE